VGQIFAKKSCNISEVTWKTEISSIEQHNISFALNDAPKSNCEKVLATSKKFRNKLGIFNTFKFIYRPLFSTCHHYTMLHITYVPHTKKKL